MAYEISAEDFLDPPVRSGCFVAGRLTTLGDLILHPSAKTARRASRRVSDQLDAEPQSQVDRLIADLMDIIVRAATGEEVHSAGPDSAEAIAEVVALSMMQGLLEKEACSRM